MSKLQVDDIVNKDDTGSVGFSRGAVVTGVMTATTFSGALTGNATGLTGTPNIDCGTGSFTGDVDIADKIVHTGDTNTAIRFPAADTFTVETGGSEAIRVDSSQRLVVGANSALSNVKIDSNTGSPLFQVEGSTYQTAAISLTRTANSSPYLYLNSGSSGNNATGSLGRIMFNGFDGTNYVAAASISGLVDGTPGTDDMPGSLLFQTSSDGSQVPTERLRIDPTGIIQVKGDGGNNNKIYGYDGSDLAWIVGNNNSDDTELNNFRSGNLLLKTNGTERLRIASSGQIGLGGANYGSSGQVITSNGSGSAPTWQDATVSMAQTWRITSDVQGNASPLTNWEALDTLGQGSVGSAMSHSNGIFTFPSTGVYLVIFFLVGYSDNHTQNVIGQIVYTSDNSSYSAAATGRDGIYDYNNSYPSWGNTSTMYMFDITDTSNQKVRFDFGAGQGGEYAAGNTGNSLTTATFIRLGNT